jgi:hypothetical protein
MQEEANLNPRYTGTATVGSDITLYPLCNLRELLMTTILATIYQATEEHWQEHEVIVLDPNHGIGGYLLANDFCKAHVGLTIRKPIRLVKIHFTRVIMEQGPEDGVREAIVVAIGDVIVEVDGLTRILLPETLVDEGSVFGRNEEARPADPSKVEIFLEAREGRDETTR